VSIDSRSSKSDGQGGVEKIEATGKVMEVNCWFVVDFYNSSDTPKSLRETCVEMVQRKTNETHRLAIVLPNTGKNLGNSAYSYSLPNVMTTVNFPPREMLHLRVESYFGPEDKITVEKLRTTEYEYRRKAQRLGQA
jgi:hypothetical protein